MNNELQLAKTRPAIPKTMRPTKPADFLDHPATNPLRSGLPIWKGNLKTAVIEGRMDEAARFMAYENNGWWVYFVDGRKPIIVYCKKEELEWIGLEGIIS